MRINPLVQLPAEPQQLALKLTALFGRLIQQVNGISEGQAAAVTNAYTAAPTTGQHAQGDFVLNSAPTELGSAGSKYIIMGWTCIASGTPGTWVQTRALTGN